MLSVAGSQPQGVVAANSSQSMIANADFTAPLCTAEKPDEPVVYTKEKAIQGLAARGISAGGLHKMLCVNTLMRGCVSSFIEFYRLSHRSPICIDRLAGDMFSIAENDLPWIADTLSESEESKRQSKFSLVYQKYIEVADFFEKSGDHETAINFHVLGLRGVKLSSDKALEGEAHEQLGAAHERLGRFEDAVRCYETFLTLAEASRDASLKNRANANLIRAYMAMAQQSEEDGSYDSAREFYEKAVCTASNNGDSDSEAEAYSKLGNITVLLGDLHKALEYQKRFLLVSKQMNSERQEGRAVRECAVLQERLEQHDDAASSLKRALEIAEEQEDLASMEGTCRQLGQLYSTLQEYPKSVHYFKEAYRVAQVLDEPRAIQTGRVNLGMAQGCLQWSTAGGQGFVSIINSDLITMLDWKASGRL